MLGLQPPGFVAVPTHFFKLVVAEVGSGSDAVLAVGSFVVPNAPVQDRVPLTACAVPLRVLEALAGLELLPSVFPAEFEERHVGC